MVERDSYLLELCRYVVLNPVRARIVRPARDYRWSSYRATAGLRATPELLCTEWILAHFGEERSAAQRRYRRFVTEGVGRSTPWAKVRGQLFLGQEGFVEDMRAMLTRARTLHEVPRQQRYADRPALEDLFAGHHPISKAQRDCLISEAHLHYGYSFSAIGRTLGLHYTTVSKVVKTCMAEAARSVSEELETPG